MHSDLIKTVTSVVLRALTMLATLTAYCTMFGAISGWLAVFFALVSSLLIADVVGDWWDAKGYDATVNATASCVTALRRFGANVAAKVTA